jgi:hypothetical protein
LTQDNGEGLLRDILGDREIAVGAERRGRIALSLEGSERGADEQVAQFPACRLALRATSLSATISATSILPLLGMGQGSYPVSVARISPAAWTPWGTANPVPTGTGSPVQPTEYNTKHAPPVPDKVRICLPLPFYGLS